MHGKTHLHLFLAVGVLLAADVGTMQLAPTLLLDLLEGCADLFEVALVHGVLETTPLLVLLLELLQFLLLLLELRQPRVYVVEQLADLGPLRVGLGHDAEGFCAALFIHLCASDLRLLQERKSFVVFCIRKSGDVRRGT